MTPQLTEAFKKSLKSNRWESLELGAAANYTNDNMVARWITEKNKWLQVSENILFVDSNVLSISTGPSYRRWSKWRTGRARKYPERRHSTERV